MDMAAPPAAPRSPPRRATPASSAQTAQAIYPSSPARAPRGDPHKIYSIVHPLPSPIADCLARPNQPIRNSGSTNPVRIQTGAESPAPDSGNGGSHAPDSIHYAQIRTSRSCTRVLEQQCCLLWEQCAASILSIVPAWRVRSGPPSICKPSDRCHMTHARRKTRQTLPHPQAAKPRPLVRDSKMRFWCLFASPPSQSATARKDKDTRVKSVREERLRFGSIPAFRRLPEIPEPVRPYQFRRGTSCIVKTAGDALAQLIFNPQLNRNGRH